MHVSNELHAIPAGRLAVCRVLRGFTRTGVAAHFGPGEVVHLPAGEAGQLVYQGNVEVTRDKKGVIATVDDPAYVPPSPPGTAKVRVLRPVRLKLASGETVDCAPNDVVEIPESDVGYACQEYQPAAERVA